MTTVFVRTKNSPPAEIEERRRFALLPTRVKEVFYRTDPFRMVERPRWVWLRHYHVIRWRGVVTDRYVVRDPPLVRDPMAGAR
jgi:hypothetical protein